MSELTRFELDLIGGRRNPLYAQIARLKRIEKAAREVLEQVKGDPEYLYVITDPRKASAALIALRQALTIGELPDVRERESSPPTPDTPAPPPKTPL
jgi:hypothetical protein